MASKCCFVVVACLLCAFVVGNPRITKQRDFAFGTPYSSNMVLQRAPASAVVWGYGTAGANVAIEVGDSVASTTVKDDDTWEIVLPPQEAGGPYQLVATQNEGGITTNNNLDNVLFGDVWVCSGQSNMEFNMGQIYNSTEEIQASLSYTQIRLFQVQNTISETPLTEFSGIDTTWTEPTQGSVNGFSALCVLYGRQLVDQLQIPIGLVDATWGGTKVEAWSSAEALTQCSAAKDKKSEAPEANIDANSPSALYNAMINPFVRTAIKGAIWYQGESNVGNPNYACMFPAMINDWRVKWNTGTSGSTDPNFPFGFVQLAANSHSTSDGWPLLRWTQTANYGYVPNEVMVNTFMAVALDLPDDDSPSGAIHPRDKQTVARRLAVTSFNVAYGLTDRPTSGPVSVSRTYDSTNNVVTLEFDTPLLQRNTAGFLADCGSGWVDVPITSLTNSATVTVDLSSCPGATQLAYEWRETPCPYKQCALYADDLFELPSPPWIWSI